MSKKKRRTFFDKLTSVAAFIYPLSGLPQAILVSRGSTEGVSLLSWMAFAGFSILFLVYGLMHKIKPIIITNVLWLFIDAFIICGTLAHKMIT